MCLERANYTSVRLPKRYSNIAFWFSGSVNGPNLDRPFRPAAPLESPLTSAVAEPI
jgi:hypothetical protein